MEFKVFEAVAPVEIVVFVSTDVMVVELLELSMPGGPEQRVPHFYSSSYLF